MKAIRELVRVFCSNYGKVEAGETPINAILPDEACEYIEISSECNKPKVMRIFAEDKAVHQKDLKDA